MDWLIARLKEKSTWIGVATAIAGAAGWTVGPELASAIGTAGVAVVGLVLMVLKERSSE